MRGRFYILKRQIRIVLQLEILCIFSCLSLYAQNPGSNFWFDDARNQYNPAIPDPEYLTHDAHYNHYFESLLSQELLNLTTNSVSYQGLIHYQWFPEYIRDHTFRWNFGGSAFIDKFGPTERLQLGIRTGLNWISPEGDLIAGGITLGYQHHKIDLSGSELLQFGDPRASSTNYQKAPDVGFGLFFSKRIVGFHDLFLGISVPHLYKLDNRETDKEFVVDNAISILAGANIFYTDYGYLEPIVHYRTSGESMFNLRFHFRKSFWLGVGYDSRSLANGEFGIRFRNLQKDSILSKSTLNYWRLGISYRFWNGSINSIIGNRLGLRLAYIWH